ncbi:hypothetical protein A6A19_08035 [Actinobacillus delphinicola]|uniref:peptidylprolyl isomerase n=1 Tax=Actinobacillus delphinicola TaxID=51161 RepID=A0A448TV32_9PAST|nr:peptidylprolyl isomerase [Actinobacillus delphinicola]MDG6897923.1 hypothetical protein [Actinobacillus delphinicola]VEJ09789.1 Putative peptidyl-prolyl cis-trans isomerase Cbf2 precursor [Actinobacillus delphinicola]
MNIINLRPGEQLLDLSNPFPKIMVNGVQIKEEDVAREMLHHPAKTRLEAREKAAQALVIQELLRQACIEQGIDLNKDNEEEAIACLLEKNIQPQSVSEEDCVRFYKTNPQRFFTAPLVVARHILFAADKDDLEMRAEKRNKAEEILAYLKKAPDIKAAFLESVNLSDCRSRDEGGLLGQINSGDTVPEFERQIFVLNEGLSPKLIETRYGYHIVFIEKHINGKKVNYEVSKSQIYNYLAECRYRQAVNIYLHLLVEKAQISGIELQLY